MNKAEINKKTLWKLTRACEEQIKSQLNESKIFLDTATKLIPPPPHYSFLTYLKRPMTYL